ncbi:hypothetical protein [Bradyrhizobium sp.]|jgi:hypothetical protein|uniref:hypothetical protein n=1 Tax=Bradyrhizobium sp. TaxID=376 RepID=UPI002DF81A75|nr:hypothetical protein [Bradyrhizobium sp.]
MAIASLFALETDIRSLITWDLSQILPYRSAKRASLAEFGGLLTETGRQPLTAPIGSREINKELI